MDNPVRPSKVAEMSHPTPEPPADHTLPAVAASPDVDGPVDVSRLASVRFRAQGLLWDRPHMDDERFLGILADPDSDQYLWAWTRVLERLPSPVVTQALSLRDLQRLIRIVRLRPPLQEAWESAIEFWTEESRCRIS